MVKKLKPPPFDLRRLLRSSTPAQAAAALGARDDDADLDDLLDVILDDSRWDDGVVQMKAVEVLCALGHDAKVADVFIDLAFSDDDDEPDFVIGRIGVAVGRFADLRVADLFLFALNEQRSASGAPPTGWTTLLEVLSTFAERGHRDERTWVWLERLRAVDPLLWTVFVNGCGDARAVPLLQAIVDDAAAGLDVGDRAAADAVAEAVAALDSFGAARDEDVRRRAQADVLRATAPDAAPR